MMKTGSVKCICDPSGPSFFQPFCRVTALLSAKTRMASVFSWGMIFSENGCSPRLKAYPGFDLGRGAGFFGMTLNSPPARRPAAHRRGRSLHRQAH